MKKIHIIALHLAYGGVEKAVINMANLFADRYDVEIISVYNMPNSPAFPLDERVKIRYLLKETPNREQWHKAVKAHAPIAIIRESFLAAKILIGKKLAVKRAIREIHSGIIITTRHEDNMALSKYGRQGVYKIAQLHHDHRFEKKYVKGFHDSYGNIDVLAMLSPGLAREARDFMPKTTKTKVLYIPNFLIRYPQSIDRSHKEKTIIAAGRLESVKGFDRLIRSYAKVHTEHPEWKLKIFGEGSERAKLEAEAEALGLKDCALFPGSVDSEVLESEMLRASVYVMSSHSEGFPFVIIEAQSCSLPTVAYDVRVGPQFMVNDGEDGFLVSDGDENAFAAKINELVDSKDLREGMGEKALVSSRKFSREQVGKTWFSVLGEYNGE